MQTTDGQPIRRLLSIRELLGMKVHSRRDEDLGKVVDVRCDPNDGRVLFLLIGLGGLWGFGEKIFAVPFSAFALSERLNVLYLDIEKDIFDRAAATDLETWSVSPEGRWSEREVFLLNNAEMLLRWGGQ